MLSCRREPRFKQLCAIVTAFFAKETGTTYMGDPVLSNEKTIEPSALPSEWVLSLPGQAPHGSEVSVVLL